MQNDYKGPLADFAMVIPVPAVLREKDVKVLRPDVFDRVDSLGSPRLVEYWEEDPCPPEGDIYGGLLGSEGGEMSGSFGFGRAGFGPGGGGSVQVEAKVKMMSFGMGAGGALAVLGIGILVMRRRAMRLSAKFAGRCRP